MALIIRKLDTSSRREVNRFIDLPFRIYRRLPAVGAAAGG